LSLRLVERDVAVRTADRDANLRSGIGSREKDVLLQAALRRNGWRNAAKGDVSRLDNGDGRLGNAGVIDLGESEDRDDTCGIDGCGSGRRRRRGNGRRSLIKPGSID